MRRNYTFCIFILIPLLLIGCTRNQTPGTNASPTDSSTPSSTAAVIPSTNQQQAQETLPSDSASHTITEEKAKEIALSQVPGATEQNIRDFHSDYDNGRHHYDGKIYYGQTEYEFEIDSSSGTILDWEEEPLYCDVP